MHKEDELRSADVALGHGVGGDVEGGEVGGRGDVVMHGDLWREGPFITQTHTHQHTSVTPDHDPRSWSSPGRTRKTYLPQFGWIKGPLRWNVYTGGLSVRSCFTDAKVTWGPRLWLILQWIVPVPAHSSVPGLWSCTPRGPRSASPPGTAAGFSGPPWTLCSGLPATSPSL